jgi:hypothetical protein
MEFWEQNYIIGNVNGIWDALVINREEDKILNNVIRRKVCLYISIFDIIKVEQYEIQSRI